jgi:hypothetical protein
MIARSLRLNLAIFIIDTNIVALTRQEKEKLVLEPYTQGKTYRQIAEEARICPRDITIVEKPVKEKESMESMSVSSDIDLS